jgi:hypothetical protein
LTVNQQALATRKKTVLWEDVATFTLDWDRDRLMIEEIDNPIKWGKFELRQVGNLVILLELAAQQLPIEIEIVQKNA